MSGFRVKRIGYFGKMPKAGDFISRNIDMAVKDGLDRWLQAAILESRTQLKESWLGAFLTAPIWRFLLSKQFGSEITMLGVMIPSVDKVGRYFPLAVLIELVEPNLNKEVLLACDRLLDEFEEILLGALSDDIDQDYFDYQIGLSARKYLDKPALTPDTGAADSARGFERETMEFASLQNLGGSIWWTEGSDHREADMLLYPGMPASNTFAAFLRDPNQFRELEAAWDAARDLGPSQNDNPSVDFPDKAEALSFHLISHAGRSQLPNSSAAVFNSRTQSLLVSDGRFGSGYFAMASRMLGKVLPEVLSGETSEKPSGQATAELQKVDMFMSAKFPDMQRSVLGTPFSFAYLAARDPHEIQLFAAGDYVCLHKHKSGVTRIFGGRPSSEDATIRQDEAGLYKSIAIRPEPGDRMLLCSPLFDSPYLTSVLYEALSVPHISEAARSAWQNATIQGLSGNVALVAVEFSAPKAAVSELQPQLGIE